MTSPLPLRPSIDHTPLPNAEVDLSDPNATTILNSLSSKTARSILLEVATNPATASDIASAIDTSVQNVQYHLSNLCEADIITSVGTWYSSKGKEMTVYALTSERVELKLGTSESTQTNSPALRDSTDSPTGITVMSD